MRLSELKDGERGIIVKVLGSGAFRKRIIEMGFVRGQEVSLTKYAPLKDPIEYNIMDYEVALRRSEADLIEIILYSDEDKQQIDFTTNGTKIKIQKKYENLAIEKSKEINVALVGNPNCGKTTLFNFATGANERVGNYGGVTIDSKTGKYKLGDHKFYITDLPGTYSISAYSPEELFVRQHIIENMPDVVVNIVDASNLERNLYLTSQLIDMDVKVVIALNMYDELQSKKAQLDIKKLSELLRIPIIPTTAIKGEGINDLFNKVIEVYEDKNHKYSNVNINYGTEIENAISVLQSLIENNADKKLLYKISSRFIAVKLLENDKEIKHIINNNIIDEQGFNQEVEKQEKKLKTFFKEDPETIITDSRYGFIEGALKETFRNTKSDRYKRTKAIDYFVTHKIWGFPIFIAFLYLMFVSTFKLGEFPMDWIDWLVQQTASLFETYMPDGMLKSLIVDGIIGGVGAVIIFLPNILILFLFVSLMEDTGYMARVAFIMDKLMHRIGLHGKSIIPLLMGFGCNVPAIMATRTIENRKDRLLTMLINPFMSCSARLPIYILIAGAVFPKTAGTVVFLMYISGILLAILVALVFKKTVFKSKEAPFVMELPPYRRPTAKVILRHMWHKARTYLKKMGGIILIASIIIWALGFFPRHNNIFQQAEINKEILKNEFKTTSQNMTDKQKETYEAELNTQLTEIDIKAQSEQQAKSYIGIIGHFFEPVMRPLGFDWKMTIGIISGVSAKEIVVSTLGVIYQTNDEESLQVALQNATYDSGDKIGQKIFTPVTALAFLLFTLIYFPCIATVAAVKNESGSWKWAIFMVVYSSVLAWLVAFAVYQIGNLF